jgi:hypothetical protein
MRPILSFLLLCLSFSALQAQTTKFTLSGTVKEAKTGEVLIGVSIFTEDMSQSAQTNEYGFYSITLPQDSVTLIFSVMGMEPKVERLYLNANRMLNVELREGVELNEVEITANSAREMVNSTQMGVNEVTAKEAKEIPVIFGEVDLLKVLQLKPGVQSGGEGSSGIYVRGGGSDQNLFVLDEAPVYNPSHLFGFFSTFNADAIKNVVLYKAAFPAEYGGKLSSVIDVSMREGNRKKFSGTGGLGLISSRLTLEGPIVKDKGSFLISGRRTYIDLITGLINEINRDNPNFNQIPDYNFYDLNAKFNYDLNDRNKVFLSGYFGRDVFQFKNEDISFDFFWGNASATARWNNILSPKLFVNHAFTFSDYNYTIATKFQEFGFELGSGIRDFNLKSDFSWYPAKGHDARFGYNAIYHRFLVNRLDAGSSSDTSFQFQAGNVFHAGEYALYFNDDWTVNPRLKVNMGLRLSGFNNQGQFYWGLEPRLSAKYSLSTDLSLKASYARMYQYIHLVSTSGASLPTDIWYPSTKVVRPQSSDLISAGLAWAIKNDYFLSIEGYYKWLHNQIDFRDGANLVANSNLDEEFVFGKGSSYGAEVYLEKKVGDFRGWIGYTLSWSWRTFPDIMEGRRFHPRYDRRHDASVVLMYDLPWWRKRYPLTLSATWVYGTGNAISLPVSRYFHSDIVRENPFNFIPVYTERNGFRMPAYHRMDLGLVWQLMPNSKRFKSDLTLSIYNVYSRLNAFFIYIDAEYANEDDQLPTRFQAKQVSLFPIIPTLTWNFQF